MIQGKNIKIKNHFPDNFNFIMARRGFLTADLHRLTGISNSYLKIMSTHDCNATLKKIDLIAKSLHAPTFIFFLPHSIFRYIVIKSSNEKQITTTNAIQLITEMHGNLRIDENGCSEETPT